MERGFFSIEEFKEMKMQPSLERALRHKEERFGLSPAGT
jgi:hypothetical protein